MPINQPSGQIKLTNVSIVRLKKGGKRFEIACYKNKVQEWRNGVEKDLDEVLQISNVFMNVSKGEVAKAGDLKKAFGTDDRNEITKEILNKGELQVGDKEREHDLASLRKEIATLVAEKCVDPATQTPYSVSIIEKAMQEAGYSVKANKNAKSQVSECIKQLQSDSALPIQRARMRIRVTIPWDSAEKLKVRLMESAEKVEHEEIGEEWSGVLLIDPGQFRVISDLLIKEVKGKGRVETITFSATASTSGN
ncbi:Shwachman-Bodian-diamond syndrome protein [Vararia minispora EC-137]|uniref:Shwachman-Bodian-diamond syndrome protein n=1 Tax=Vararia minispora EC-137 TaxID=1314806 RepID=A0ACB8QUA5_9AGAM|nr:Shwachman-Bodian-diamond syndrome protein [Vararia minispora EC-137]